MLNGSVVDVGISQRSELPLISPQDSQDSGQKKKWETARLQHAQHVIKNKWLLLVGDGGKTQTKSESVARCQYTAYSRCLSLSRSYNHTESKKPCKPCSGEPSFRYTCVCLSQIHTSHYIFLLWWYIYIYYALLVACFVHLHRCMPKQKLICRCYDLQGIEYISFLNYDQIKYHSLSMGPWLLIFFFQKAYASHRIPTRSEGLVSW